MAFNNKRFSDVRHWDNKNDSEPMRIEVNESQSGKSIKNLLLDFFSRWKGALILLLALVLLWKLAVWSGFLPSLAFPTVPADKWQAVFLVNNQVYFGHLEEISREYVALSDVYYIRTSDSTEPPLSLIKLGNEIYGPEDPTFIPKNQILFWENMRDDSQVVQALKSIIK